MNQDKCSGSAGELAVPFTVAYEDGRQLVNQAGVAMLALDICIAAKRLSPAVQQQLLAGAYQAVGHLLSRTELAFGPSEEPHFSFGIRERKDE